VAEPQKSKDSSGTVVTTNWEEAFTMGVQKESVIFHHFGDFMANMGILWPF